MNKKIGILFAAFLFCAIQLAPAFANRCSLDKHGMDGECSECRMDMMEMDDIFFHKAYLIFKNADEIKLGDDQKANLKSLKYKLKRSTIAKDSEIEVYALDIKEILSQDEVTKDDLAKINDMIDKKYELKKQKAKDAVAAIVDLKKMVTKDQMKRVKELWEESYGSMKRGKMSKRDKMDKMDKK